MSITVGLRIAPVIEWVDTRGAAKHLTRHRTAPRQRAIRPQMSTLWRLRKP